MVIPTDPAARAEYFRQLGSAGGRRTVERHGEEHMQAIGRRGFRAALDSIGGEALARILAPSYRLKYGRDIDLSAYSNPAADAIRAEARRLYPDTPRCSWEGCQAPGQARHHLHGLAAGNGPANVVRLCTEHHIAWHRRERALARATRQAAERNRTTRRHLP